tara:strand:- start:279 stop:479 length:201 start_codon:yes stop_codon:yes gene_type:complete
MEGTFTWEFVMRLYSFELVLFGWLAYNIFVELHDWVAESFEENEQTVEAPEPVAKPLHIQEVNDVN